MSIISAIKTFLATPRNVGKNVVSNIIGGKPPQTMQETGLTTLKKAATAGAIIGGVAVLAAVPAAAGAALTIAKTVGKALIPTSTIGKVIGIAALPAIAGAGYQALRTPETLQKTAEATFAGAGNLFQFGSNVGAAALNPTLANGLKIVKENPYLSIAAITALLAGLGYSTLLIANIVSNARTRGLLKETQDVLTENNILTPTSETAASEKVIDTGGAEPQTQETTAISKTTGIKRRKARARVKETPSVRQNVQVVVSNRAVGLQMRNKTYLKRVLYA